VKAKKLSSTQLAKRLGLPGKAVFALLESHKWIKRVNEQWSLTAKGEFEGGEYRRSDKFGQYIVWPESVLEHRLFTEQAEKLLSVSRLGQSFGVPTRVFNHLLLELGWVTQQASGWKLTGLGRKLGGVEKENPDNGSRYVMWPPSVAQQPNLLDTAARFNDTAEPCSADQNAIYCALDGHQFSDPAQQKIDNWLYLAGLNHACRRRLPEIENEQGRLFADFYLPRWRIYLDYWGEAGSSAALLKDRLARQSVYQSQGLHYIEIHPQDLDHLDEVLSKALLRYNVQVY
jgi:hypothetical protein